MEGLKIPPYKGQEFLYYVGCEGSFDNRAQSAARATAKLLLKSGVSFGVLGVDEISDGNEVEMLGEDGLLEDLATKNIQQFSDLAVKNIITLSPHSYNVFKNRYPCFLGRWNQEYDAPRKVLMAMKGVDLVEMERNKKGALCCGGGAGNFLTDFLGGSDESPARIRAREARDVKADILAVACPNCLTMLEDAVKVEGLEDEIKVMDISEIFYQA